MFTYFFNILLLTAVITIYGVLNVPVDLSPTLTPKSKSSKKSAATSKKSKKSKKEAPPVFPSFNLFDFFNSEMVCKYMPNVCYILQESYLKTQELAKAFYGNLFQIENIEFPQTYNEFMSGILQKYKYYYLQCMQVWTEEIQDFTMITNEFFVFANQYCSNYLQWLHETQFEIFKDKQKQFFNVVENVKTLNIADIREVQNQLKPLHGYHRNYGLLAELNNKLHGVMQLAKYNFDGAVEQFEEQLRECLEKYKNKMTEGNELVDDFKSVLYDESFCKKLIRQAKFVINSTNLENFDIELENIISYSDENLKTNSEEDLSNLIENIEDELRMQIAEEEARLNQEKMSKMILNFTEKLASLLKTWEMDMNRVIDLYKVKYE